MTDRRVLVWRDVVLPDSETFIANQFNSFTNWIPSIAGLRRRPNNMQIEPNWSSSLGNSSTWGTLLAQRSLPLNARLLAFLKRSNFDAIHAHFLPDAYTILPVARLMRIPLVVTAHGYDVCSAPRGSGRAARAIDAVLKEADAVVAVSDYIEDRLLDLGVARSKVSRHYIGIPKVALPQIPRTPFSLVFVGRLVEKKGVKDLLIALARVQLAVPDVQLTIVGDGPEMGHLRRLAESKRLPVRFAGFMAPAETRKVVAAARLLVAPSRTASDGDAEGLGMVFLEAASVGTPAVAYAHGGVPEAVSHGVTGLLAPEGDSATLATYIIRLLLDAEQWTQMSLAARERVERNFDIVGQTAALEGLLERVVQEGRRK